MTFLPTAEAQHDSNRKQMQWAAKARIGFSFGVLPDVAGLLIFRCTIARECYIPRLQEPTMREERTQSAPPETMSVADAIRLKHALGRSITWGNSKLNAMEVAHLTRLSSGEYEAVRKEYAKWHATAWSNYTLIAVAVVCIVVGYSAGPHVWLRVAAIAIGIFCFYTLARRDGHAEGYIEGYDAGYEAGIYKALGIEPPEVAEMSEMHTEMQIDDVMVKALEKAPAPQDAASKQHD